MRGGGGSRGIGIAIAVDGLGEHWLGGVNYYRNFVSVFDAAADPDLRLHVLTDDTTFFSDLRLSSRVTVMSVPMLRRRSSAWMVRKALNVASGRDLQLLALLSRLDVRAVLFKYVAGAASCGIRTVPWIPDFQSQHLPELFPPAIVAAERKRGELYVRDADDLLLSSQAACDDAVRLFGARRNKLHVLRFAPKIDFAPLQSEPLRDEVLQRYQIDRPYFLLPNQYWQHKNHRVVIDALHVLRQRGGPMPRVVSTGRTEDPRLPTYFADLAEAIARYGLGADYQVLGVIPRQDMLTLLAHSLAVINPSRFEGWSTTVEEAKALGKPMLVSNIAVHREQVEGCDDYALFEPDDAATLAELLASRSANPGSVHAHPPQPRPALYDAFARECVALMRSFAAAPGVTA